MGNKNKRVDFVTDKERILMDILQTILISNFAMPDKEEHCTGRVLRTPKAGELVACMTGRPHKFTVGYLHEWVNSHTAVIRDISSNDLCNVGNEDFAPLAGIKDRVNLLWGSQHIFDDKVRKAFRKYTRAHYSHRFGGIDFLDDNKATIWVREAFGGMRRDGQSIPYSVEVDNYPKASIKKILAILMATHKDKFDFSENKTMGDSSNGA